MTATLQRDQAIQLAKTDGRKALAKALSASDPWFRAQALSWEIAALAERKCLGEAKMALRDAVRTAQ